MLGRIFNSGLLKLLLAVGVLVGIVMLVNYARQQADLELSEYSKQQDKNKETSDNVVVDNYELKEIGDDNNLHWRLTAKKGTMETASKDVALEEVNVNYYKEGKLSMTLVAPVGKANEISRIITLASKGNKKVTVGGGEKQATLETSQMELKKDNQFIATGGVNIVWPGVAKVTGNRCEGSLSSSFVSNLIVRGNTHTTLN